ncbi:CAMK family protein kinase [Histomonas meleagridis]|uniref:CAMK family protein kinase n=1 Tax=Histomonas meleagridis TaxID=135588 RepID=UPI00355A2936|nr:CAMK family protein kinase [Histomonas meleagridis]KAH0799761.1 CAMK family protein kinase [Histomonas meleagridis]
MSPNSYVYSSLEPSTAEKIVLKLIDMAKTPIHRYETETRLMKELSQKYIMKIRKSFDSNGFRVLVMNRAIHGDLNTAVRNGKIKSLEQCGQIMYKLLLAVNYLHSNKVLHGDIKDANVLLFALSNGEIDPALIDFEFASILKDTELCHCNLGTDKFASPELLSLKPHSFPTDIWSLGVTFYILLSGKEPFPNIKIDHFSMEYFKKEPSYKEGFFKCAPPSLKKLIRSMLNINQNQRPTAEECLKSSFFTEILGNEWINRENEAYLMSTLRFKNNETRDVK